jgi:hypothetical protein
MKIYDVHDVEFKSYGKILDGYNVSSLIDALRKTEIPDGVKYIASDASVEDADINKMLSLNIYGGMPVQIGWCNGHNTKLNCLEYHRDSEINLGTMDFILLLAKVDDLNGYKLDSSCIKAFKVPAGCMVEIYSTTLHYAPCHTDRKKGFQVMVALPKGTNGEKPEIVEMSTEDRLLFASNKWLIAHRDAEEAKAGAFVGISGENIDIAADI